METKPLPKCTCKIGLLPCLEHGWIGVLKMDEKKDFFHIGRMTETFKSETTEEQSWWVMRRWELRILLTIAQQLAVISGHLGKILEHAEDKTEHS